MIRKELPVSETHRFPTGIYWKDTDAAGVVWHANYHRFLERCRSDFVRGAGIDQGTLLDSEGVMFPVRRCEINYLQPAHLDNQIEVRTRVKKIGGANMEMGLDIHRGDEHIVRAKIRLACVGRSGRPQRLAAHIRAALNEIAIAS